MQRSEIVDGARVDGIRVISSERMLPLIAHLQAQRERFRQTGVRCQCRRCKQGLEGAVEIVEQKVPDETEVVQSDGGDIERDGASPPTHEWVYRTKE